MTALDERRTATALPPRTFTALVVVIRDSVRSGLVRRLQILGAEAPLQATSVASARMLAVEHGPGALAVVDAHLPDGDGVQLATDLRRQGWSRTVVLGDGHDPQAVRAALAAGVNGFVVTPDAPIGPAGLRGSTAAAGRTPSASHGLYAREIDVLRLVSQGRTNRDVAEALGLSALTVKSHLARIARKLGTGDRAEMVVIALRAGIID
mgnify:CR=1 FL=1